MSNAALRLPPLLTVDEFLSLPRDPTGRLTELVEGEVRAQDPASDIHGTIQANLIRALGNHLIASRPGCRVVATPGVQPRLRAEWNFRVPDLGVTCAPNQRGEIMIPEPLLLVEILSPSNARDTWSNVPLYATLPSVAQVLIVHAASVKAELFSRDLANGWAANATEFKGPGVYVPLTCIAFDLPLTEIYRDTYLSA